MLSDSTHLQWATTEEEWANTVFSGSSIATALKTPKSCSEVPAALQAPSERRSLLQKTLSFRFCNQELSPLQSCGSKTLFRWMLRENIFPGPIISYNKKSFSHLRQSAEWKFLKFPKPNKGRQIVGSQKVYKEKAENKKLYN